MKCPKCQAENREGISFCEECGNRLEVVCPNCSARIPPGKKFCGECGHNLTKHAEAPRIDTIQPEAYTPKHLADKILQSRSALEGERKQVTVLFADVEGSMELAERVDPEEWHRLLDRFFQILADGIHRYEGTINQYTGDGIMALFGAPIAHEDHAHRACYAALHLREELRRYADELRRGGLNFSTRMGLNSGEVVVGKIGDDLRMDYTAQGQTVGLAQRMEQRAAPDTAYLSASTARLVEGFFKLRDLGEFDLKGMATPVRAHELVAAGPIWTRLQAARSRGLSRFVGRVDEMAILELAIHRATEGNGQVVGIVGEAGVGKSRLCLEFVEGCRAKGIRVFEAHCPAHGRTIPLLPFLELLRDLLGVSGRDQAQQVREAIAGRLILLDREFEATLPIVFEFLGVADPEHVAPAFDPEARQRQLFTFTRRLVAAMSAQEPLVLLVDDLQWIDPASDGFLDQITDAVSGSHALLLVNFRPEYEASWMRRPHYQQVPLLPLGPEEIKELLHRLLGRDPSVAPLIERIGARTGGNPFFIEEVVQSLAEVGSLEGVQGGYGLTAPVEEVAVPASVQAVLAARIDRLPDREKQLLQMAAVIGKEFAEKVLENTAELPRGELADALAVLRDAGFIREQALYPAVEYAFKHPLTHEVALNSQLRERRARVHAAVGRAIEGAQPQRLDEKAAELAHHWEEAGEWLAAARWHRRAAEWVGASNFPQAVAHWEKVRKLAASLPEDREALEHRLVGCQRWLGFVWRMGAPREEIDQIFAEGKSVAEKLEDPTALFQLYAGLRQGLLTQGLLVETVEIAERAYQLGRDATDPGIRVWSRVVMFDTRYWLGDLQAALCWADELLEMVGNDDELGLHFLGLSILTYALGLRGYTKAELGMLEEGEREIERAVRLGRERGHDEETVWAFVELSCMDDLTGEFGGALDRAQQALELAERVQSPYTQAAAWQTMGLAHLQRGEAREALEFMERAYDFRLERGTALNRGPYEIAEFAAANLAVGNTARARLLIEEGFTLARRGGTSLRGARLHLVRAQMLRESEGPEARYEIEATLAQADELIREKGARAWAPLVCEERARLAQCLRDPTAERHLHEAHRLFVEMGATGHAKRLARELGL
jgi:class 3 adenylate cyclase/tetratricopeptide (TPR) repeat protein